MKIIIENFKNITHLELNIVNNKAILLGANGVGKSNVLEAIYKGHWWMKDSKKSFDACYLLNLDVEHSLND
ncbi:MAG: AAA family ATPase, partial [Erysipelotrichaceae bacterium]|nr:AAA family ATPase [Erysipelotrichaceae bacterium]